MRIALLVLIFFPLVNLYGQNLEEPFLNCNIKGSITLYDYNAKKWIASDINDSHMGSLPASTFKIINTLVAIETGVITNENEIIKWPGKTDTVKYGYRPDIYHDMSMKEAFKLSAGWVYVELANKIGKDRYKEKLTDSRYGNADVSIDDVDFWNFGKLAISPVNQIEILIGVYEETLPFSKRSFKLLKEIMIEEQTNSYILRSKTGWTRDKEKDIGWWVGYVERKDNIYFFSTRLVKDRTTHNPNFGICRKEITKTVLRQINAFE
jgi:beta-lactamase class D